MDKSQINQYRPDKGSHPGATLKDLLEERNLTQVELATRMGRPQKTISEIVSGKAAITPETALELEMVLGVPARFWNTREQHYREFLARQQKDTSYAEHYTWASNFPLKEMAKLGLVQKVKEPSEQVRYVLQYLGVNSPDQWTSVYDQCEVSFRKSSAFEADQYALGAWLRAGVVETQAVKLGNYKKSKFLNALECARGLTNDEPPVFQHELKARCAEAGVAVAFIPQLPRSLVSGATRWLSPHHALIQLSLRYKTNDHLWFTFFHEAAHVLLHGKKSIFLDTGKNDGEEEQEANTWAANFLIPKHEYELFTSNSLFTATRIVEFAKELKIAPGIVVGRLQHDKLLPFNRCNDLKIKFEWSKG